MTCRCAPSLVALRNEINDRWPNRDKASDGCCGDAAHAARKSDHNADASGYAHAHDFDEDLFSGAGDRPLWDTLRPILLADPRAKYCIYEARIMYPDGTNKPYTGINAHAHHLHLSIKATATHDTRRWLPEVPIEPPAEDDMRTFTVPVPWLPGRAGADPYFVVDNPDPNKPNVVNVASVNDAPFKPAWKDRQDLGYAHDFIYMGLWWRQFYTTTGKATGPVITSGRVGFAVFGDNDTYTLAEK